VDTGGQAPTAAAISAALSAAFSRPMVSAPVEPAATAADSPPRRSMPLLMRGGLPSGPLPNTEGLLGQAPGAPRQSSAPDALLSARCHSLHTTTSHGWTQQKKPAVHWLLWRNEDISEATVVS